MIEEALSEARRLAHDNRLEGKNLDEVDELEDDEDHDFLEQYRWGAKNQFPSTVLFRLTQVNCAALTVCSNQRLEELSTIQFTSIKSIRYRRLIIFAMLPKLLSKPTSLFSSLPPLG